ncbi:hypothetical protein KIN20_013476 [Parelaphostrongylus tenuis]|uniref:RING-CH-type domain-containing protein n=1 Tax=Parelaphostrongylus tenuis TaxID=148309 RepID=A0AAD5QL26_PARTN|nr:hypothetical protein KIN20_013476 [Parelaphostrongylus tenuis]
MMPTIVLPAVSSSDDVAKAARSRHDTDAQSTASADSGNGSLNNNSIHECNRSSSWSLTRQHSEEQASPASLFTNENQPLITKNVDEAKETVVVDVNSCPVWLPNQHVATRLGGSKGSVCSSSIALCRICHTECESTRDPFVSPCRCSGSLLYVHRSCLVHWLELSTRKMVPSPRCELCGYNYKRRNCVNLSSLHFPHLSARDRLLNVLFIFVFIIMIICAVLSIHFLQLSEQYHSKLRGYRIVSSSLSDDELTVVVCSVLFFAAFFIAVFTQYRAEASICRVIFRCWTTNRNWTIRHYNIGDDPEMLAQRQARFIDDHMENCNRPECLPKTENCITIPNQQMPITVMESR